jgi:aldehyde:ferredoxin oxidoreductase
MSGYMGAFLKVNLSEKSIKKEPLKRDLTEKFIGGKGFAAKILFDEVKANIDPLSPENLLLFMTGPLTGTKCPSTRIAIVTKSPLTNAFNDSYVGGFIGPELKFAGYDGLIIKGRGENPVLLYIKDEDVDILNAGNLWGKNNFETERHIKKIYGKDHRVACIGRAGEKLVKYASINTEYYRQAGRGGVGAVMGSKNLKAIVIKGSNKVEVDNPELLDKSSKKVLERLRSSEWSKTLTKTGTATSVPFSSSNSLLPTRNFQSGTFEEAEKISGEHAKENLWDKNEACFNCPIACGHIGRVRSGEFSGSEVGGPEYETCAMLGSNCGLSDLNALAHINMLCDDLGLDTISTGNVIAFAMECYERGILSTHDLDGIDAKWGDPTAMIALITKIAEREGIGNLLAEGVKRASKAIGGGSEKFAMHVKGLEMPGWGVRGAPSMGLHYATCTSGASHERAWMIGYDLGFTNAPDGRKLERYSIADKADVVKYVQDLNSMRDSLVLCDFVFSAIDTSLCLQLLNAVTGFNLSEEEYTRTGERIWNLTKCFNLREGLDKKDDSLPSRLFDEPLPAGEAKGRKIDRKEFELALSNYYGVRGWDENGVPTKEKLIELRIDFNL